MLMIHNYIALGMHVVTFHQGSCTCKSTNNTAPTGLASVCQATSAKSNGHAGTNWQSSKASRLRAR